MAVVVNSSTTGTILVNKSNPTTTIYGDHAVNKLIFDFSSFNLNPSRSAPCQGSPFGIKNPNLAVIVATINPVIAPRIEMNSGPNNQAYSKADNVYTAPMSKVHDNNGNASLNDLFLPKNFVKITTIVNGINVPANRSSAVICIPTSLKSAISASGKLLKPTTTGVPTAPNGTGALSA